MHKAEEPAEVLVPIEEALPGMRIVGLPEGQSWVGAFILVKTQGGWSARRTEGLSDAELLGAVTQQVEMLYERSARTVRSDRRD